MLSSEDRLHMWPEICGSTLSLDDNNFGLPYNWFALREQAAGTLSCGTCPVGVWLFQMIQQSPLLTCRGWGVGHQNFLHHVHTASYDPPEQPLLNRGVRGRPRVGRGLATPTQNWIQSRVASQCLEFVQYCRGCG